MSGIRGPALLPWGLFVLALAALGLRELDHGTPARDRLPVPGKSQPLPRVEDARLAEENARLRRELAQLGPLMPGQSPEDRRDVALPDPSDDGVGGPGGEMTDPLDGPDPHWYLREFLALRQAQGPRFDYLLAGVRYHLPTLVAPLARALRDGEVTPSLRALVLGLFGDARLRGDPEALGALFDVLEDGRDPMEVARALLSLRSIGDAVVARPLEECIPGLRRAEDRVRALDVLLALAGEGGNGALERVFRRTNDTALRIEILERLRNDGDEEALALLELASLGELSLRRAAALALANRRGPAFEALAERWFSQEPDAGVRALLDEARLALDRPAPSPRWSPRRATGRPDANADSDDPNAWASQRPEMGEQWLELTYDPPLVAYGARIFEVNVAGALVELSGFDAEGRSYSLWAGVDPLDSPGVLVLEFPPTPEPIARLRLVFDTDRRKGWSEIDAVELFGPWGRAWASGARASSYFGQ